MIALWLVWAAAADLAWVSVGAPGEQAVHSELALGLDEIGLRDAAPPDGFAAMPVAEQVDALRPLLADDEVRAAAWLDPNPGDGLRLHLVFATETRAVVRLVEAGDAAELALAVRELLAEPPPAPPPPPAPEPAPLPP
ncbi:MAG: hypothetical protein EP330_30220, partial [Deltaproteobacteria bacterium]